MASLWGDSRQFHKVLAMKSVVADCVFVVLLERRSVNAAIRATTASSSG